MTTRISYRKGGEEKFKEITDKPQCRYLDNVAPPKAEDVDVDRHEFPEVFQNYDTNRKSDGDD